MSGAVSSITSGIKNGVTNEFQGAVHGNLNQIGSGFKHYAGSATRGGLDAMTFGTAELGGVSSKVGNLISGSGAGGDSSGIANNQQSPAQILAQTGGAPLLTNIALGVDPKKAVAGYFGQNNYDSWYSSLGDDDKKLIDGVTGQLTTISQNVDMRNQAVTQLVNDFPNVVATIAPQVQQAKAQAGEDFDSTTKAVLDQASSQLAAKYGASGGFSSGAFNQGLAQTAGDVAMNKLSYVANRGDVANADITGKTLMGWQNQYNEANALRSFQQTMLGQGVQQGFSATQAALNRNQQGQMQQNDFNNQNNIANKQQQNQLFGAIGGLAGTAIGASFGGPVGAAAGGSIGSSIGGGISGSPNTSLFSSGSGYSRYAGNGNGY